MSTEHINNNELLETFQLFDTNKDGSISIDEFRSACERLHMPIDTSKMKNIFQDRDYVSFEDFCHIMRNYYSHPEDAYFNETFQAFDKNSDGFITAKEIKQTMKELGEKLTDKQAKQMVKAADANHDGKLSKDEFRTLFNQLVQPKRSTLSSTSSTDTVDEHASQ